MTVYSLGTFIFSLLAWVATQVDRPPRRLCSASVAFFHPRTVRHPDSRMSALANRCYDCRSGQLTRALLAQPQPCQIESRRLPTSGKGQSNRMPRKGAANTRVRLSFCAPHSPGQHGTSGNPTGCCTSTCPRIPNWRFTPMTTPTPSPSPIVSTTGPRATHNWQTAEHCLRRPWQVHIDPQAD